MVTGGPGRPRRPLQQGDVITEIDGQPVNGSDDVARDRQHAQARRRASTSASTAAAQGMTLGVTLGNAPRQHPVSFGAPARPARACWRSRCWSVVYVAHQRDRGARRGGLRRPAPGRRRSRRGGPAGAGTSPMLVFALALAAARRRRRQAAEAPSRCPVERASIMLADRRLRLDARHRRHSPTAWSPRAARPRDVRRQRAQARQRRRHGLQPARRACCSRRPPTASRVDAALDQLTPSGGTATGRRDRSGRSRILRRAPGEHGKRPPAAIVLISDGASTSGRRPASPPPRRPRKLKIPVYTVALGTAERHDHGPAPGGRRRHRDRAASRPTPPRCAQIAQASGGRAFTAADAQRLNAGLRAPGLPARAQERPSARSPPASPAAASRCCCWAPRLSLRWFGRLI